MVSRALRALQAADFLMQEGMLWDHLADPLPPKPITLNMKQWSALKLLARGHRKTDVARSIGVDRHTITRWERRPDWEPARESAFAEVIREAEMERYRSRRYARA